MSLNRLIFTEILKLRRSNCLIVSTFGLSFIPIIVLTLMYYRGGNELKLLSGNEWSYFIKGNLNYIGFFLIKIIPVLIPVTFVNIEFEKNGIKQYLISPNVKYLLFLSKIITLIFLFIWALICFYLTIILNGFIIGQATGRFYSTFINVNLNYIFISFYHVFLSSIGILMLSYSLMLLLRSQIKVIFISLLAISISLTGKIKYSFIIPFKQPSDIIYSDVFQNGTIISKPEIWSVIYFILFIILSYFIFTKHHLSRKI